MVHCSKFAALFQKFSSFFIGSKDPSDLLQAIKLRRCISAILAAERDSGGGFAKLGQCLLRAVLVNQTSGNPTSF